MKLEEAFAEAIRKYYEGETPESVGKYTMEYFDEIESEYLDQPITPTKKKKKSKKKEEMDGLIDEAY